MKIIYIIDISIGGLTTHAKSTLRNSSLLTDEDRALLRKMVELLESILETLDVLLDEHMMHALKEAEEDLLSGNIRNALASF